jgi:hypothetical protein
MHAPRYSLQQTSFSTATMTLPAFCNLLTANSSENSSGNLSATLINETLLGNLSVVVDDGVTVMDVKRIAYSVVTPIVCLIGMCGNTLNLVTLRNNALQTVPFMYIRLVAVFDLLALSMILISSLSMGGVMPYHPWLVFYLSHVELVFINTFLTASLYCALVLTVERYILISHPHLRSASDPKRLAQIKIGCAFLLALLLHVPMILQYSVEEDEKTDKLVKVNNRQILCNEPSASIYHYYKQSRECFRLAAVVIMSVLNGVIARKLQLAKQNRRRMTLKQQKARVSSSNRKELALLKSFTEKKLTVLMFAICIIYLIGNLPQAAIMVLHTDAMESKFGFQVHIHETWTFLNTRGVQGVQNDLAARG